MDQQRRKRASIRRAERPSMFLLMLILIIQLNGMTMVLADEEPGDEAIAVTSDQHEADEAVFDETGHGLLELTQVELIPEKLVSMQSEDSKSSLLLVAIVSPSCPYSDKLLQELEGVVPNVTRYFGSSISDPPAFAKLDGLVAGTTWLQTLGVTSFPALVWFIRRHDSEEVLWMKEPHQEHTTASHYLYETILHTWYRYHGDTVHVLSPEQDNERDPLVHMLQTHGNGMFRHVAPALHPDWLDDEMDTIQWLMGQPEEDDPYVVFVQCRHPSENDIEKSQHALYDNLASILATRRDVAFFAMDDCTSLTDEQGVSVLAVLIPPLLDWTDWKDLAITVTPPLNSTAVEPLEEFVVTLSTPSVMWFDRHSVAPIAFPIYRQVHATLFVPLAHDETSRLAIQELGRTCRNNRWFHSNSDMVCLVVPHTETRLMTTFGIDIWTLLDAQVMNPDDVVEAQLLLPMLLLTDQRFGGTRKYYLPLANVPVGEINSFVQDFWKGKLSSVMPSASHSLRRNKSHVQIITSNTFAQAVLDETHKHTLLYLFAPTCGHCKRFSILWNSLSRLIHHLGWNTFLDLAKMDVTENEIIHERIHLDVQRVPDVYYFPKGSDKHQAIRYDVVDSFGDGAGRLRDPLDILEWLLDIAEDEELDESVLWSLLQDSKVEDVGDEAVEI